MKKNSKMIIKFCVVLVVIYIFFIKFNCKNIVLVPDKIIIYSNGMKKEVDKQNTEFINIVKLTNKRFKYTLYSAKDMVNDKYVNNLKKQKLGVEFIYFKKQKFKYFGNNMIEFNKLYFPLVEENKKINGYSIVHTFQYGHNNHYMGSSMGKLNYSKQLIKVVENYK